MKEAFKSFIDKMSERMKSEIVNQTIQCDALVHKSLVFGPATIFDGLLLTL